MTEEKKKCPRCGSTWFVFQGRETVWAEYQIDLKDGGIGFCSDAYFEFVWADNLRCGNCGWRPEGEELKAFIEACGLTKVYAHPVEMP